MEKLKKQFLSELDAKIQNHTEAVMHGVDDMAEYRRITGAVRAYKEARELFLGLVEEHEFSDD